MNKVLVAEDDSDIRELLMDILKDAGYDVVEAKNGVVALEKVTQEHPDVVLLDIGLPILDGFGVTEKLREDPDTESLPVILLTALPAFQGEQQGMKLGALNYISKPWNRGVVQAAVKIAMRGARPASADETGEEHQDTEPKSYAAQYDDEPEEVEDFKHISTAGRIMNLEKILDGGLGPGTLTLIEGPTTAGKSVICQHFIYGALTEGHEAAYFTSEHTPYSFGEQMKSIGLDIAEFVQEEHIGIYPMEEPAQGEDSSPALALLARDMEWTHEKCDFITIDAISNLAALSQEQAILAFFSSLRQQCSFGRTTVVVAHSHAFSEGVLSRLRSLCDNHFKLRTGKVRAKMVRTLEVAKANGTELDRDNQVVFEVVKGEGAHVMPVTRTRV